MYRGGDARMPAVPLRLRAPRRSSSQLWGAGTCVGVVPGGRRRSPIWSGGVPAGACPEVLPAQGNEHVLSAALVVVVVVTGIGLYSFLHTAVPDFWSGDQSPLTVSLHERLSRCWWGSGAPLKEVVNWHMALCRLRCAQPPPRAGAVRRWWSRPAASEEFVRLVGCGPVLRCAAGNDVVVWSL